MSARSVRAIGVDVGTSSVKAVRIRVDGRRLVVEATASRGYGQGGRPTRDPAVWVRTTRAALSELVDGGPLDAVGYTGQMHALVPVIDGAARAPASLWLDYDGEPQLTAFCRAHPELALLERTGNIPLADFTLAKWLRWRDRNPTLAPRVERLPAAKDHVRDTFTSSVDWVTDVNEASGTQLYDPFRQAWDGAIVQAAGIPRDALPRVVDPAAIVGTTMGRPLPAGVPVVAGTGDQAAAVRGLGADVAGRASLSMGTSGVLSVPWRTAGLPGGWNGDWHLFPTSLDGAFGVIATIPALAGSLLWVAQLLGTDIAGLARLGRDGSAGGVRFFPYLGGSGAPHPDVNQRGQLRGFSQTTTMAELARGVLEGVANELAMLVEETRGQGVPIAEVVLSGGLAAVGPLTSLIGGRAGVPAWRSGVGEASAVGAALTGLQGVAAGHHATGERVRIRVRARDRTPVDDRWRSERETILAGAGR